MKYELRSIGIWSLIKISFILNFALGIFVGILYALMLSVMLPLFRMRGFDADSFGLSETSIGALLIILPLMFAFFGAVFNTLIIAIAALLYNGVARVAGGLELSFSQVPEYASHGTFQASPQTYPSAPSYAPPPPPPQTQQPSPDRAGLPERPPQNPQEGTQQDYNL